MNNKNGGPAFPRGDYHPQDGMTLRDWFAGKAMEAYINTLDCAELWNRNRPESEWAKTHVAFVAKIAGMYADAMLAEKAKREEK